jgi:hypothetical protein
MVPICQTRRRQTGRRQTGRTTVTLFAIVSVAIVLMFSRRAFPATKLHSVIFGKWTAVQFSFAAEVGVGGQGLTVKVRPLIIDARTKEFTFGAPHDVTERLFVVRRAFRVNDSLPQESASPPRWKWEQGGWLLVDRTTGHVSPVNLPEFDSAYSEISWYRDYAAYCGISDDGRKTYAIVAQIARRKPILKTLLSEAKAKDSQSAQASSTPCVVPEWQRGPARVTFESTPAAKVTFAIRGHSVDMVSDDDEEEQASR